MNCFIYLIMRNMSFVQKTSSSPNLKIIDAFGLKHVSYL